jgi:hypothetical protein
MHCVGRTQNFYTLKLVVQNVLGFERLNDAVRMVSRKLTVKHFKIICLYLPSVGRNSSVGLATRYGLDGPGIESRCERDFPTTVQTGLATHPTSYTFGTASFPGLKRSGRGVNHPTLFSTEVKERVELYLYFPSGPSWPALAWTLHLPLFACPEWKEHEILCKSLELFF